MTGITNDISKGVTWISRTFSGADAARYQRDIPGQLARWLFRIGTIAAAVLFPITVVISLYTVAYLAGHLVYGKAFGIGKDVLICPYLLTGYAIWLGWGWRSRQPRNVKICVLFWLASAGFNVMQPVHTWMDSGTLWDLLNPLVLWGIASTSVSLIALLLEFFSPKYDSLAA